MAESIIPLKEATGKCLHGLEVGEVDLSLQADISHIDAPTCRRQDANLVGRCAAAGAAVAVGPVATTA